MMTAMFFSELLKSFTVSSARGNESTPSKFRITEVLQHFMKMGETWLHLFIVKRYQVFIILNETIL